MSITLWQGDCLELMKDIPDKSVDMILCDLPYGTTENKWDSVVPFVPLWDEYYCVIKQNAAIVLFSQMPFSAALVMSNPIEFRYEWIWEKTNPTGFLNAKKMPLKYHENICVFYQKAPTYNPQFWTSKPYKRSVCSNKSANYRAGSANYRAGQVNPVILCEDGKRYPRDIIVASNSGVGVNRGFHPTQKPISLLEYLIKTYTNEGETVLDNCMGSGSTGVACVNTNRSFIGIELDPAYFAIAQKRIAKAQQEQTA